MDYIIIPNKLMEEIPVSRLEELHLSPRRNIDMTEVILKCSHFKELFKDKLIITLEENDTNEVINYPYKTYNGDELRELLNTPKWSKEDI